MDHAEAHELLADLALEPARLRALGEDASPATAKLRAHLDQCPLCAKEVATWLWTWAAFSDARGATATPDREVLRAPVAMRSRVLEMAAPVPVEPRAVALPSMASAAALAAGSRRWSASRRLPWLAVAASLVVTLGAGGLAWVRTGDLDRARAETTALSAVAATMERVLADPVHWVTPLQTADGAPGGTLAWSATDVVVVSSALPTPGPGQVYHCWVERDGKRTPIGTMDFTAGTGYWVGSMTGWAGLLTSGARFGVSLVPAAGGEGAPVLVGSI